MATLRDCIPNALSLSRIPIAFFLVVTYTPHNPVIFWLCVMALALALITDVIDGRLARSWKVVTDFGYFLDGLCDKIVYSAVLVIITREHASDALLPWMLILREILIYAVRTLDDAPMLTQRRLRPMSMTYAFFIRSYFLGFLVWNWTSAHAIQVGWIVDLFFVPGYAAMLCGYGHLYLTLRLMREKLRQRHRDGDEPHDLQRNLHV